MGSQVSVKSEFGKVTKCGAGFRGLKELMMTQSFQKLGRGKERLFSQGRSHIGFLNIEGVGGCK